MARSLKEFMDVFIRGETLQEQSLKDARKKPNTITGKIKPRPTNKISGDILPRNRISGSIIDRPAGALTDRDMADIDTVIGTPARRAAPTRMLTKETPSAPTTTPSMFSAPEFPITRGVEDFGATPAKDFDWDRFIEVAGTMGAALSPQGTFAKAGLAAAADVKERRAKGVAEAKTAEDKRRFEIETKLKEVDDRLNQAKFDYQQTQDASAMERVIKLEGEKSRIRMMEQAEKDRTALERTKITAGAKDQTQKQTTKNRVRAAKDRALTVVSKHAGGTDHPLLVGLEGKEREIRKAITQLDLTGDETADEIIQMALDSLGKGVTEQELVDALGPDEEETNFVTDEDLLR